LTSRILKIPTKLQVYIIISDDEGNPRDAFLRAGILTAKTTIVVGSENIGESGSADSTVMANMLDAHWISMVNPDLELISELNQGGFARKVANGLSQVGSRQLAIDCVCLAIF
jgi:hypothetical protein